jgi:hypothetical protein
MAVLIINFKISQLFVWFIVICLNNLKIFERRKCFFIYFIPLSAHFPAPWTVLPGAVALREPLPLATPLVTENGTYIHH